MRNTYNQNYSNSDNDKDRNEVDEPILKEFVNCGAILKGHFILSSGLHSDAYIQCALLLQDPQRAENVAKKLIEGIPSDILNKIDLIVAPAMGGLIIGHEIARLLKKNFIFFERVDNIFVLKRGFSILPNTNILLVEDVITTGGSSLEVIEKIENFGANVIAELTLVDRRKSKISSDSADNKEQSNLFASEELLKHNGKNFNSHFNFPIISLLKLSANIFSANNIPEHLKNIPAVRPGSKKIL